MNEIHIYLVSDSTGETVINIARAAFAHFERLNIEEHLWSLVRTKGQIDKLTESLQKKKGIVMYTLVNEDIQEYLRETCANLNILAIPVLEGVVSTLSTYLGIKTINLPGRQHRLNEEYFTRINAINFALAHDDGQAYFDIANADIILVGPSRTSKSPTSIYLAYRGYKTANVPFVLGQKLPEIIENIEKPLIVGLLVSADRLIDIRKTRINNLNDMSNYNYVDYDQVHQEIFEAKKIYQKNKWPIIDVTKKSVEETATNIIRLYEQKKERNS
jgi:[pyruvate, water dikinase]-phosphate phosphotransferase / [pyruvate, water dikinase] kinase|tara:strand:+ start:504 stop:1322 length:819 start_codon:yes stop_codon:yes gene_type:complete